MTYFEPYLPERFCRDYVEARGHSQQLAMFMSVVLGFKPLMDDWVGADRLAGYLEVCRGYGLHVRVESMKLMMARDQVPAHVVGGDTLTSTFALGLPPDVAENGAVHVFLSRDRRLLDHGMWYPTIIRDRVIWPPYADVLKFGRLLGYPDCCIRFFRQRNDWARYSFLYEIFRNTAGGVPHPLCNPLTKDRIYSYIYHMPCRFDCPATQDLAGRLRAEVRKREPRFAELTDAHLALPALVFRERKHFVFDGILEGPRLSYRAVYLPDGDPDGLPHLARLEKGDAVEVEGQEVRVFRDGTLVDVIEARAEGFAPEHPFMIRFA